MATASSRLCIVAFTRPNSITGQTARRKRASDVPPVVEASGSIPVSSPPPPRPAQKIAPGCVRNGSPEMIGRAVPPCFWAMAAILRDSSVPVWVSLKRIEMRASALRGDDVMCRIADLDIGDLEIGGLEPVGPFVEHQRLQFRQHRHQPRQRIVGQVRIGDVALACLRR